MRKVESRGASLGCLSSYCQLLAESRTVRYPLSILQLDRMSVPMLVAVGPYHLLPQT